MGLHQISPMMHHPDEILYGPSEASSLVTLCWGRGGGSGRIGRDMSNRSQVIDPPPVSHSVARVRYREGMPIRAPLMVTGHKEALLGSPLTRSLVFGSGFSCNQRRASWTYMTCSVGMRTTPLPRTLSPTTFVLERRYYCDIKILQGYVTIKALDLGRF